jgi:hypothetical protein
MSDAPSGRTQSVGCFFGIGLALIDFALVWVCIEASPAVSDASLQAQAALLSKAMIGSLVCATIATIAWTRSRRIFQAAAIVSLLLPCSLVVFILTCAGRSHAPPVFTSEDRVAPELVVEDGRRYLVHRALGFRALAPPEQLTLVSDDAATAAVLARSPDVAQSMTTWRWASASGAEQFVLVASAGTQSSEVEVRRRGFETMVASALDEMTTLDLQLLEDRHVGEMERVIHTVSPTTGAVVSMHYVGYQRGGRFLVVAATGTTMASVALDEAVGSLSAIP